MIWTNSTNLVVADKDYHLARTEDAADMDHYFSRAEGAKDAEIFSIHCLA